MAREAGDAQEEAHDEVRADRPVRAHADPLEERRQPQRPEDEPDRPAHRRPIPVPATAATVRGSRGRSGAGAIPTSRSSPL
jgi:hypothetical protein